MGIAVSYSQDLVTFLFFDHFEALVRVWRAGESVNRLWLAVFLRRDAPSSQRSVCHLCLPTMCCAQGPRQISENRDIPMLSFLLDKVSHWLHLDYQGMPTTYLLTSHTQSKTTYFESWSNTYYIISWEERENMKPPIK